MIRIVFILLVIVNFAYFIWGNSKPATSGSLEPPALPKDVQILTLLREQRNSDSVTVQSSPEDGNIAATNVSGNDTSEVKDCYTVGPFRDPDKAAQWAKKIRENGLVVSQREKVEKRESDFWVYLPSFDSKEAALEVSKSLANGGVNDYFVVTEKENKNSISLGLFSSQDSAQRRVDEIKELGYEAKYDIRYQKRKFYWLDYESKSGNELPAELWQSIATDGVTIQQVERTCN